MEFSMAFSPLLLEHTRTQISEKAMFHCQCLAKGMLEISISIYRSFWRPTVERSSHCWPGAFWWAFLVRMSNCKESQLHGFFHFCHTACRTPGFKLRLVGYANYLRLVLYIPGGCLGILPATAVFVEMLFDFKWYCWWKKSSTTWDLWNLVNNGINYLSTGAGFLPSTVTQWICSHLAIGQARSNCCEKHWKHGCMQWAQSMTSRFKIDHHTDILLCDFVVEFL